jgi:hypothetical protein
MSKIHGDGSEAQEAVRNIESSMICEEEGKWVVQFFENGKSIGTVHVFNGYTKSGWDQNADVTDEVRFRCEDHAVEQYKAVMVERVRMMLEQMSPGSIVGVIPIEKEPSTVLSPE